MPNNSHALRCLALAAGTALACSAAQANITVYSTLASFSAATSAPGGDGFSDLSTTTTTPSPLLRTTSTGAAYSYTASSLLVTGAPSRFFAGDAAGNPFLSPNFSTDYILLNNFSSPVNAVGGNFFASDYEGHYFLGDLTIEVIDGSGTKTVNLTGALTTTFIGVVSDSSLVSVKISSVTPDINGFNTWPSVDNVVLAVALAVPEPETYALMLSGLAFVGFLARRRASNSAD